MRVIWATRGQAWGFRFLRSGGFPDPLVEYEKAFAEITGEEKAFNNGVGMVAFRFLDPLGRKDRSGRVIPHAFVIFGEDAERIDSVDDGIKAIWPQVSDYYASVWDSPKGPEVNAG